MFFLYEIHFWHSQKLSKSIKKTKQFDVQLLKEQHSLSRCPAAQYTLFRGHMKTSFFFKHSQHNCLKKIVQFKIVVISVNARLLAVFKNCLFFLLLLI
jgi:hypothetical protein